ncbi:plasma membrane ascorbate-dependent reductase CYBRD1 isoform X1 [Hyalella azteca]|uniref:Plasma membrane ascorbate-dependent reductase CYBRD1 isoform X1 n=1 Tax=Hyalella azteca TaxID=294128 RepID=A0A8B7PMS3_HYAAZ|nr:plasma membrane ascorbate-dependent reductase CYBRD1 isoform X1 [Hyalella azteca]
MTRGWSCLFYLLVFLTEVLLFGVLILSLVWVYLFRDGFAWNEDVAKQFNLHPVLMITGFIFLMGNAMLVYRLFRCCNKLASKILHTFLYLLAVPCIVVATIAVFDNHNLRNPPIPNLYSLHSWLGLVTMGLFALQVTKTFVVGFFSFWILLCCDQGTSNFRANLLPIHSTFGIITFMLAVATAVSGYTEKAIFSLKSDYAQLVDEAWYINAQGISLVALAILMCFLLFSHTFSRRTSPVAFVEPPSSNNHYVMTQKSYYYREHDP